ncbi:MAG TPA: NFACT RNA binding domain-containing protein [Verrucomicrobiae bacterium]|nr:NFACT RNA binding domain-containing protein [Verrucomicrobiae bacterium]
MDARLLLAVRAEIERDLVEQEVHHVASLGPGRVLLRFATPRHDDLLLSVRPELPRMHLLLRAGGRREEHPDPFVAILDREIAGARLVSIAVPPGERVARLEFLRTDERGEEVRRSLVAVLFGRGVAAHLLGPGDVVLASTRTESTGGPVMGAVLPPLPPRPPGPPIVQPASFVVRSTRPLEEWREGVPIAPGELKLVLDSEDLEGAGGAGGADAGVQLFRFESPSEAAAAVFEPLERFREFEAARARHESRARKEASRLASLEKRLLEDRGKAERALDDRRLGEALLAGLNAARVEGDRVHVPDPLSDTGATLDIPIDPALSLPANAERLFGRFKKAKRGLAAIDARLGAVSRRWEAWAALEAKSVAATTEADLAALRDEEAALGVVHAPPPPRRRATAPSAPPARVRRHTTRDGFVILVGKSGPENDTLTFKVASPWDFWLHAAGAAGAHVVVRNPRRLDSLPEGTLRTAAEIAAWYSGARESGKVEVHVTLRKHVRKSKGMAPGQVTLRRFRSIQVIPRLPGGELEEP